MKGVSLEVFRVSISSAPSSSSQGSVHEDYDSLGEVFMWGEGIGDGFLGGGDCKFGSATGAKLDALLPKALGSGMVLDVQHIACGGRHVALVTKQGEVFCWGEESGGRLGHGVNADVRHPQMVEALANNSVEHVACGEYHTCAVTSSGDLYTWGDGTHKFGLLGRGTDVSCWMPRKVNGPLEGICVASIACGPWHTALVTTAGQLFTFGDGTFGVLGHGNCDIVSSPKEVESLKGLRTIAVACGVWHTAAVIEAMMGYSSSSNCSSGKLFTWGDGDKGCLGHGDKEQKLLPTCVSSLVDHNFRRVACGDSSTVGLTTSGHIYTMGSTVYGQLGNPANDGRFPGRVEGKLLECMVEEIACGANHIAVLTAKSEIYTWGRGANGRLGLGDLQDRSLPTQVECLKDKQVKGIACGSTFTAAICLRKWVSGAEQSQCAGCKQPFSFTRKRHNCYNCGTILCHACSSKKAYKALMAPNPNKLHRVCESCYVKLKKVADPGAISHPGVTKMKRQHDTQEKLEKSEAKLSVPQLALAIIPGLQSDGRGQSRRSKKVDLSSSRVAPVPAGMPFDPLFDSSKSRIFYSSILPSRKGSRSVSPFSRRPSPPRSTTPTPTVRGLTSPKTIVHELKRTNEALSQEILTLQTQVESLTHRNQLRELEFQESEKRAKDALKVAAEEAAKCKAAKEVIKSLTSQLKDISKRVPTGTYENERPPTYAVCHQPSNGFHPSLALDIPYQASNGSHPTATPDTLKLTKREDASVKVQKNIPSSIHKKSQEVNTNGIARPHITLNGGINVLNSAVGEQTKGRLVGNISSRDGSQSHLTGGNGVKAGKVMSEYGRALVTEWVEQDEPGVYITLTSLPGGGKDLKRVRFSRKRFTERQAELWWTENRGRVFEQYNVRTVDKIASVSLTRVRQEQHDDKFMPNWDI